MFCWDPESIIQDFLNPTFSQALPILGETISSRIIQPDKTTIHRFTILVATCLFCPVLNEIEYSRFRRLLRLFVKCRNHLRSYYFFYHLIFHLCLSLLPYLPNLYYYNIFWESKSQPLISTISMAHWSHGSVLVAFKQLKLVLKSLHRTSVSMTSLIVWCLLCRWVSIRVPYSFQHRWISTFPGESFLRFFLDDLSPILCSCFHGIYYNIFRIKKVNPRLCR